MTAGVFSSDVASHQRRVIAILCADIDDDSRLFGIEEGRHERVERHRRELIAPSVARHDGRLIDTGDEGFFAVFEGPIDAVRSAIAIRQSVARHNASLSRQPRMRCRVGVSLGELPSDPDDICDTGVKMAARLQSLAEPDNLLISQNVYERVKNEPGCRFQLRGVEKFAHRADPVRVYSVNAAPSVVVSRPAQIAWVGYGMAVGLGLLLGGVGGWYRLQANSAAEAQKPPNVAMSLSEQRLRTDASVLPPELQVDVAPAAATSLQAFAPAPLAATRPPLRGPSREANPNQVVRECEQCPEMVELPGGTFAMGSNDDPTEQPVFRVTVPPFALGRLPVTIGEWRRCVAARACSYNPDGEDDMPVHNVSWNDAQQYVEWLSNITGVSYRLPTEAEWEYAARAGTSTRYWWGNQLVAGMANCKGCGDASDPRLPLPAGSFAPNPFGLHDMAGGVTQWVADCWHKNYRGAPVDGAVWDAPNCRERVLRGGSWMNDPSYSRVSSRDRYDAGVRYPTHGFRVARSRSN